MALLILGKGMEGCNLKHCFSEVKYHNYKLLHKQW